MAGGGELRDSRKTHEGGAGWGTQSQQTANSLTADSILRVSRRADEHEEDDGVQRSGASAATVAEPGRDLGGDEGAVHGSVNLTAKFRLTRR